MYPGKKPFHAGDFDLSQCAGITPPASKVTLRQVSTKDSALQIPTTTYTLGDTMYGYIEITGADNSDIYGCMSSPNGNDCGPNGSGWRKIGADGNEGWVKEGNNRIVLRSGFYIDPSYPVGRYTGYSRKGQDGEIFSSSFTVVGNSTQNTAAPKTIYTKDSGLRQITATYKLGDTLYGYIEVPSGNIHNVYGCMASPNGNACESGAEDAWRKVGADGTEGWVIEGNRIVLRSGFPIDPSYPVGKWAGYARYGKNGNFSKTEFTVTR